MLFVTELDAAGGLAHILLFACYAWKQTPHAVLEILALLTMGIIMPETCGGSINHE
jgi:hypothetical protein